MGSDSPRAFGKTQPSMDFVQSILEILICQRDDTHSNPHRIRTMDVDIDDIFSGTGPCNDQAVGLPTTQWNPQVRSQSTTNNTKTRTQRSPGMRLVGFRIMLLGARQSILFFVDPVPTSYAYQLRSRLR
jgi:hypothetical protein